VEEIGLDDYRYGAALIAEWPDHAGASIMRRPAFPSTSWLGTMVEGPLCAPVLIG
jgi:hypothetical protein